MTSFLDLNAVSFFEVIKNNSIVIKLEHVYKITQPLLRIVTLLYQHNTLSLNYLFRSVINLTRFLNTQTV